MAYSTASISSDESTWLADGKPILGANVAVGNGALTRWVKGTMTKTWADAATEDSDHPSYHVIDNRPGTTAKPDGASTAHTILFDFSANPIEFDWIGVMNHDLDTRACTTCQIQVADDNAYAVNLETVFTRNISTSYTQDRRFGDLTLTSGRYSNVEYARMGITITSGIPYIGQIIFGRRRQQKYHAQLEFGEDNQSSDLDQRNTRGGVRHKVSKAKGRRDLNATLFHDETALQTDLIDWWADIHGGNDCFFWYNGGGGQDNFWMFDLVESTFAYPHILWQTRQFDLAAVEQGPDDQYFSQGP